MLSESTIADTKNRDDIREYYYRYREQGCYTRVLLQILRTGMPYESTIADSENRDAAREYYCRF